VAYRLSRFVLFMTAGEAHRSQLPKLRFFDYLTLAYPKRSSDYWAFANLTRIGPEVQELFSHIGECIPQAHAWAFRPSFSPSTGQQRHPKGPEEGFKMIGLTIFHLALICTKPPVLYDEATVKV
jgi:hypothetical protein